MFGLMIVSKHPGLQILDQVVQSNLLHEIIVLVKIYTRHTFHFWRNLLRILNYEIVYTMSMMNIVPL